MIINRNFDLRGLSLSLKMAYSGTPNGVPYAVLWG